MAADRYNRFAALRAAERAGVDYRIVLCRRDSPVGVIAPHGGTIEPGTSEIAAAIAGEDFSLYCFEGLRRRPHSHLHITSPRFDEPQCLGLVAACDRVVAVHGLAGRTGRTDVGGRNQVLRDGVCAALQGAGFEARIVTTGDHAAIDPRNICNRGRQGRGVQLEVTRAQRDRLVASRARLVAFADAIRVAVADDEADR